MMIQAQYHFFATTHKKLPCDGIVGTTNQFVAKARLQATENYQILIPYHMFPWTNQNIAVIFSTCLINKYQVMQELINQNKDLIA